MTSAHDRWTDAVLDAMPHPMLIIDPRGSVAHVNRAAAGALGYPDRHELLGRPSHDALHRFRADGAPYPAHECPIVRTPPTGAGAPGRETFLDRSGHPLHVTWTVSPLPDPRYKLLAFSAGGSGAPADGVRRLPSADDIRRQVAQGFRDPELTPQVLAKTNDVSLRTLQVILAREGSSPAALIRAERLRFARELLGRGKPPAAAAFESGFSDADTFARAFRRHFGRSAGAFVSRRSL